MFLYVFNGIISKRTSVPTAEEKLPYLTYECWSTGRLLTNS